MSIAEDASPGVVADPKARARARIAGLASMLISVALLVVAAHQFRQLSLADVGRMVPASPLFWLAFAGYYLSGPISEWFIYRRVWAMSPSGFGALVRKLVSNEILLGYLGEAQFYAWARSRMSKVAAPFAAIKDVTILSALTGNLATLAMLAWAWPLVRSGSLGMEGTKVFASLGVVLVTSFVILLFRRQLFSLPRAQLLFISIVHLARIAIIVILSAVMWHLVLPAQEISLWIVLATMRMLVSRLPVLPNKDVVFAGIAVFLFGQNVEIGGLMTMMAVLLLVTHLAVGALFAVADLFDTEKVR